MDNLSHFRSLDELIRALDRERGLLHALFQDRKKLSFRYDLAREQARWWSLRDISALLTSRYPNFDPETPFHKIGLALNDVQFNFQSKRKTQHMEYFLIEK